MGVATDCGYTQKVGGVDEAIKRILQIWNQASALYASTFNVRLGIIDVVVQERCTTVNGMSWNRECSTSYDMGARLSDFSQWRGTSKNANAGLWHLVRAFFKINIVDRMQV
jgi:hypothetical protein